MARYGYIRLDNEDKDTTRQADLLDGIGDFDKIFVDRNFAGKTKKDDGEKQLLKVLSILQAGDTLYVASADRIFEKIEDFIKIVNSIKSVEADFCCLDINFDTRSSASSQVLRTIEALNKIEKTYMSRKKKEGIANAKKQGRRVGRPPVSIPPGFRQICAKWAEGEITGVEAIKRSGLKSTSFYTKAKMLGFKRKT